MSRALLTVVETKMIDGRFQKRTLVFRADASNDDESMLFAVEQAINDGGMLSALRAHVSLENGDLPIAPNPAEVSATSPAQPAGMPDGQEVFGVTQAAPKLPFLGAPDD